MPMGLYTPTAPAHSDAEAGQIAGISQTLIAVVLLLHLPVVAAQLQTIRAACRLQYSHGAAQQRCNSIGLNLGCLLFGFSFLVLGMFLMMRTPEAQLVTSPDLMLLLL